MKFLIYNVLLITLSFSVLGCEKTIEPIDEADTSKDTKISVAEPNENGDYATLTFSLSLDLDVYDSTDYGEPPQFAIWLENPDSNEIRTIWVTYRMGKGIWKGKMECPVALPYWVSRYNKETSTVGPPTFREPLADAVTGATPKHDFTVTTNVEPGSSWNYFLEINVSGDYNQHFPAMRENGAPDPQANGQPSLIYKGTIESLNGKTDTPKLIARTKPHQDSVIPSGNSVQFELCTSLEQGIRPE